MNARQLRGLEDQYLRALCVLDLYRLQGLESGLSVAQFAATQSLDWNEYESLAEWLTKKDVGAAA